MLAIPSIGTKFGKLTIISGLIPKPHCPGRQVNCRCDCGTEKVLPIRALLRRDESKATRGCGKCFQRRVTHGHTRRGQKSKTYSCWRDMLNRVKPNHEKAARYFKRGIAVCDRWQSFENFLSDMGEVANGLTIDRIDNDLGYSKANCRWATLTEQARNKSTNNRITLNDETKCLIEWLSVYGMTAETYRSRLALGWSIEKSLTFPIDRRKANKKRKAPTHLSA